MNRILLVSMMLAVGLGYWVGRAQGQIPCEEASSFWDGPDEGILPDGTGRGYGTLPNGERYIKGEVAILFKEGYVALVDSVWKAGHSGSTKTGIDSFDALGAQYGLKSIEPAVGPTYQGNPDDFIRRNYQLLFPEEVDIMEVVEAYRLLPYILYADPSTLARTTDECAGVEGIAWGLLKSRSR